ncbi:hypothetical protein CBI38_19350 [Rhodococcus oxybenzonivorans]|uniref:Uncharacterized protein n=1 Tax=Rhodococcus oxybenzonivorans TaxID=1990687 RepID=A0A2S2BY12_9NOCA|nr:hypothetical protein [Rhodococcus oxybenzonivorans]AWK73398.1 hypothetical protein CBI38_19350 [Rhodococcus oxybenzonivorans]
MEPVEVNAGGWYLRALRADERVDDRPALTDGGIDDADYIARRTAQWSSDEHYSWAICQPNTGEMLAEVGLTRSGDTAVLTGWARTGHDAALASGADAVQRFAEGALGLTVQR